MKLGYKPVSINDVKKDVLKEGLVKPKRVKDETHSQLSYEYVSRTGLKVIVHTNIIDNDFASSGARWVGIVDMMNDQIVYARYFLRDENFKLLFSKMFAYMIYLQKIVDNVPLCKNCKKAMRLTEPVINKGYVWRCDNVTYHLRGVIDRTFGVSELGQVPFKYRKLISKKESDIKYYFQVSRKKKGVKKYRRRITSTWKFDYVRGGGEPELHG